MKKKLQHANEPRIVIYVCHKCGREREITTTPAAMLEIIEDDCPICKRKRYFVRKEG